MLWYIVNNRSSPKFFYDWSAKTNSTSTLSLEKELALLIFVIWSPNVLLQRFFCSKAWSLVWYITILNHGFISQLEGVCGFILFFRTFKMHTYRIYCSFHDYFFYCRLICICFHRQHSLQADYISRTKHGSRKLKEIMLSFTITISLVLRRK